jgi:hypothetical protein
MTLPDERYRAVVKTQEFLVEILNTPRVPKAIKDNARWCLRHYPSAWDMKRAAENCPDLFQERMEPVTRIMMQYQQEQQEEKEK